jgi:hypothetical protein
MDQPNLLPLPGIETRLLGRPAFIQVTILTELSKLCAKPHLQKSSHVIFHWYIPKVVTVFSVQLIDIH